MEHLKLGNSIASHPFFKASQFKKLIAEVLVDFIIVVTFASAIFIAWFLTLLIA